MLWFTPHTQRYAIGARRSIVVFGASRGWIAEVHRMNALCFRAIVSCAHGHHGTRDTHADSAEDAKAWCERQIALLPDNDRGQPARTTAPPARQPVYHDRAWHL